MAAARPHCREVNRSFNLVAGFVLGMAQPWYVGVLAKKIEPMFGGDIGFELSAAFSGVVYPVARYIEIKKFGR